MEDEQGENEGQGVILNQIEEDEGQGEVASMQINENLGIFIRKRYIT